MLTHTHTHIHKHIYIYICTYVMCQLYIRTWISVHAVTSCDTFIHFLSIILHVFKSYIYIYIYIYISLRKKNKDRLIQDYKFISILYFQFLVWTKNMKKKFIQDFFIYIYIERERERERERKEGRNTERKKRKTDRWMEWKLWEKDKLTDK